MSSYPLPQKACLVALFGPCKGLGCMPHPIKACCGQEEEVESRMRGSPEAVSRVDLVYFGVILYILYRANVVGVGKEPIYSKSKLGNHCLDLILHIPGQVEYQFQVPFKMIFLE